jgi:hypothetical protein
MANGTTTVVNPFLDVSFAGKETVGGVLIVRAPVKGESLKVTTINREQDPELYGLLLIYIYLATKGACIIDSVTEPERERLTEIGFLVPDNQVPCPIYYSCDFDDLPINLLPVRARRQSRPSASNDELIVNPTFQHLGKNGITPEMRGRRELASPFKRGRSWFSIEDGLSGPIFYSYRSESNASVDLLSSGEPAPKELSSEVRQKLIKAGVLRFRTQADALCETRKYERAATRQLLAEQRYVVLQEIIHPIQLAAIRLYYRALIHEGFVRFGDQDWPDRFLAARDGLTYFFQQQLTTTISEIAGERIKPSFSFFASYHPGSDLKAHRDRKQCHYAMSVLLDHSLADDLSSWLIYVQPPGALEAAPIKLSLGDGLLYFGEEVLHSRPPLASGFSTHWFLFWVPENFKGSLD